MGIKLREMLKTPILQTEHIRGVEPKADFLIAGGTDFLDLIKYDLGITGWAKIHHLAESLGVDVGTACGPAYRHLIGMSRNLIVMRLLWLVPTVQMQLLQFTMTIILIS